VPFTGVESVSLNAGASPAEVVAVRQAFALIDVAVEPQPDIIFRSGVQQIPAWVIYVSLFTSMGGFFKAFGEEAGKDGYGLVKQWVKALWAAREPWPCKDGSIERSSTGTTRPLCSETRSPMRPSMRSAASIGSG